MKHVQNQVDVQTLNLCKVSIEIIDYVRANGKLPKLNMTRSNRSYYLKSLRDNGILVMGGYSAWSINEEKLKFKTCSKSGKHTSGSFNNLSEIRGHGFEHVLRINQPANWDKRHEYLLAKEAEARKTNRDITYKIKKIHQGISFDYQGFTVWLCKNSVVVKFPKDLNAWGNTLAESYKGAVKKFLSIIKGIERLLVVDLSIKGEYFYRCSRRHFAKVHDVLAKDYNDKKRKLEIRGKDGKVWLLVDRSWGEDELEFVKVDTAITDGDKVVIPFMNDLKEHYDTTGEILVSTDLLKGLHAQKNNVDSVVNLFKMYGENVVAHIDVNKSIAAGMQDFTKVVHSLNDRMDKLDKLYKGISKVYKKRR